MGDIVKHNWEKKQKNANERKRERGMLIRIRNNKRKQNLKHFQKERIFQNKVFHFLNKKQFGKGIRFSEGKRNRVTLYIPASFSFSENPNATIEFLKNLYYYGSKLEIREINIDHSYCYNLEIAASTVMDVIVLSIEEYHRKNKSEISFSGTIPGEGKVKDIFMASGLAAHMRLEMQTGIPVDWEHIQRFKLLSGYHGSQRSGLVATNLAEYIIKCMKRQGYTLTNKGKNILGNLFGEVLDNCEIHGGENSTWFALGHYQENCKGENYGEIQLVIFDFGDTIYEQLCADSTSAETKEKLKYLSMKHEKYFNRKWTKEMLYTLLSLQEGISRLKDNTIEGNKRRGIGTVKLIKNFQQIGQTQNGRKSIMTITSGNTHIRFDQSYYMRKMDIQDEVLGKGPRGIIAFNMENDIFQPPKEEYVCRLKGYFPGTVISLNFFLDREYLTQILESKERGGSKK